MNARKIVEYLRARPLRKLAAFLLALIFASLIVALITFSIAQLVFKTSRIPPSLAIFTLYPAWLAVIYLFRRAVDGESMIGMGLGRELLITSLSLGTLMGAILIYAVFLVNQLLGQLTLGGIWIGSGDGSIYPFLLGSVSYTFIAALMEELLFRGYILQSLFELRSMWPAVSLSSALFALGHILNAGFNFLGIFNIWLFGLFACLLLLIAGNLWLPTAFHFSWNLMQGTVLGFPVYGISGKNLIHLKISGDPLLTGGNFGPEASLITTAILTAALILSYFVLMKKVREDIIAGRKPFTVGKFVIKTSDKGDTSDIQ